MSSPPPAQQTRRDITHPESTTRLLIDPSQHPEPFDFDRLVKNDFHQGAADDKREMEAILGEMETLTREFALWSVVRNGGQDTQKGESIGMIGDEIQREEVSQTAERDSVARFLAVFKSAFETLSGRM